MPSPALALRAAFLLLSSSFAVAAHAGPVAQEAGDLPAGRWEGRIEGIGLDFDVDLAWREGALVGDLSIPAQGLRDFELLDLTFGDDGAIAFDLAGVPGEPRFEGALAGDGGRIEGAFTQSGTRFDFWLARQAPIVEQAAEKLAGIDEWMTAELRRFRVPGAAIAVVWRGEVVLARGYGLRDAENELPVTADTSFAIGSTTKAFTAFAIAQAVEEGLLEWDAPIVEWLPEFDLEDDYAERNLTLRDMCSHRSGLPRHDLLWYLQPDLSREELVARLAHLEPSAGFRERWQYNNLMFLTAGHVLARATGSSWEERVRERILEPLGTTNTSFGPREAVAREDHAVPHDRRRGKNVRIPFRDLTAIGPAGSIHSSANDMARWIGMLLALGEVDGEPLLSPSGLAELANPVTVLPPTFSDESSGPATYALGWTVDSVQGHLRVHHGGGIDGFVTQVELYPQDDLGIFAVTNRVSALTTIAAAHLAERMLGLEERDRSQLAAAQSEQMETLGERAVEDARLERIADAPHARPLSAYVASYEHPGYGRVDVMLEGEGLAFRFGTASAPLEHWHYEVFAVGESESAEVLRGGKIVFEPDESGHVVRLTARLEPSVAAIDFERLPDAELSDPTFLARLAGSYTMPMATLEVDVRNGALGLSVPGQGRFELQPSTHRRFVFAGLEGYAVRFEVPEEGPATTLVLLQPNGTFRAQRETPAKGESD